MNLRPQRPERCALPSCATSRYLHFITNKTFVLLCALPLSQKRYLIVFARQSATSRYILYCTTNKTFVLLCALPLSQKRYLIVFARQSATSRYLHFITNKTFVLLCALPLSFPHPTENHKLVPRFDFLPSPTLMTLWARGKGYAECYILRGKYCHHWLQYLPISLYLIIPPTNKNYKIYFYIFVIIKLLFHTFTQKCFDFFAFNFTCCCSWKSLRSYNYIYWSFIRRKLMRELFYFRFHCTFKFFFIFKS